jgi:hypothetical protein
MGPKRWQKFKISKKSKQIRYFGTEVHSSSKYEKMRKNFYCFNGLLSQINSHSNCRANFRLRVEALLRKQDKGTDMRPFTIYYLLSRLSQ